MTIISTGDLLKKEITKKTDNSDAIKAAFEARTLGKLSRKIYFFFQISFVTKKRYNFFEN